MQVKYKQFYRPEDHSVNAFFSGKELDIISITSTSNEHGVATLHIFYVDITKVVDDMLTR